MSISMNPSDHYVTQSSSYDRLLVGRPLTDRIIARRKKQGYFGDGILSLQRKEKIKQSKAQKTKRPRRNILKDILAGFDLGL